MGSVHSLGIVEVSLWQCGDVGVGAGAGSVHRLGSEVVVSFRQCSVINVRTGEWSDHRFEVAVGVSSRQCDGGDVRTDVYSHRLEAGVSSLDSGEGSAHRSDRKCGCVSVGAGSVVVCGG